MTTTEFLDRAVDVYGDFTGVIADDGTEYTYKEFGERVNRLSNIFIEWGLEYGDRVAVLSFNDHWMLETIYAANQLGLVHVPMSYMLGPDEFLYMLNDSNPRVLIADEQLTGQVEKIKDSVFSVEHYVACSAVNSEGDWEDYETLLNNSSPGQPSRPDFDEDDVATINYISRPAKEPIGVVRTFREEHWNAVMFSRQMKVKDDDVYLWTFPMFDINGWGHVHMITGCGAKHVCLKKVESEWVFEKIRRYNVSYLCVVPAVLNMLVGFYMDNPGIKTMGHNQIRIAALGEPLSHALQDGVESARDRLGWEIYQVFGTTEVGPVITPGDSNKLLASYNKYDLKGKQGVELMGSSVRVVDEDGIDVPWDGEHFGEIIVRGNQVMKCYWNKPRATEEAFNAKRPGWFHMGILATIDKNGMCEIKDMDKDIIVSGGKNISSVEVENVLKEYPGVEQCVVIGVSSEKLGETPKALMVMNRDVEKPSEEDLKEFCKQKMAAYKCPAVFEFLDSLPTTAAGKVKKFALRE